MAKKNLHLSRNAYILNIRKNQKYLTDEEFKTSVEELKASEGIMQMRKIFDHYKQIAKSRIPSSSQGITAEQIDIDRDPLEDVPYEEEQKDEIEKASKSMKTIQSFLRGKLSQKKAVIKTIKRPPHRFYKPTPHPQFLWKEYQRIRKQELTNELRNTHISEPIRQRLDLLVENQVKRFKILQEYEKELEKIANRYQMNKDNKVIDISSLKVLDVSDFYEHDYLMLYNEFMRNMSILEKGKDEFLTELLRYFQFHEDALNKYKQDVNEMYIQFATVTTATHYKEIGEIKSKFEKEQEQRRDIQKDENTLRYQIEEEQQRLLLINQDYVKLVKQIQKTESDTKRIEMERKLQEIENQKRLIQNRIESLYQTEKTKRGYVGEEEISMRHNLRGEFNAYKPKPKPKPAPHDPWEFFNPPANLGVVPVPAPPQAPQFELQEEEEDDDEPITQGKVTYSVAPIVTKQKATLYNHPIYNVKTIDNIDNLINLIKLYPSLKDIIGQTVLSNMIKTGTISKDKLNIIQQFMKKENMPITFNVPIRQIISPVSQDVQVKKPVKLEDYADLIPPRISIIRY